MIPSPEKRHTRTFKPSGICRIPCSQFVTTDCQFGSSFGDWNRSYSVEWASGKSGFPVLLGECTCWTSGREYGTASWLGFVLMPCLSFLPSIEGMMYLRARNMGSSLFEMEGSDGSR